jgi:hypothetical protein
MTEIYKTLFFGTVIGVMLYPVYAFCRIYGVYRLLGSRVKHLGFFWFCVQFQNPPLAKGMPGYVDYSDALPDNLKIRVVAIRRHLRSITILIVYWIVGVLCFGWLTSRFGG